MALIGLLLFEMVTADLVSKFCLLRAWVSI